MMIESDQSKEIENAEAAAMYDCACEAERSGYTYEQAKNCEDGNLKCKNCPFER